MTLFETVVLSELMNSTAAGVLSRAWRALVPPDPDDGGGSPSPPHPLDLAVLLTAPTAQLAPEIRRARERAESVLRVADRTGIVALPLGDDRYPAWLAMIPDPPVVLWARGDVQTLAAPCVALVGSRAGSEYVCAVAERLATELGGCAVTVVSGLARGVDGAAHRGALAGSGRTAAVLGSGVDVVYPAEHVPLARRVESRGVVVSELGPGTRPRPFFFPRRNRIISGLSRAVVVVEAAGRSGSLITARCAADQGREVMAVPGNVLTGRSTGCHALIKDGAKVVESAVDILEEIGPLAGLGSELAENTGETDAVLVGMAPGEPYDLDRLATLTGLAGAPLLAHLMELELHGRVTRNGTGRFVRT